MRYLILTEEQAQAIISNNKAGLFQAIPIERSGHKYILPQTMIDNQNYIHLNKLLVSMPSMDEDDIGFPAALPSIELE